MMTKEDQRNHYELASDIIDPQAAIALKMVHPIWHFCAIYVLS